LSNTSPCESILVVTNSHPDAELPCRGSISSKSMLMRILIPTRQLREIRRSHSCWCLAQAPALPLSIGPTRECMPTGTSPFQAAAGRALETHLLWQRRRTNELLEQLPRPSRVNHASIISSCCNRISRPPRTRRAAPMASAEPRPVRWQSDPPCASPRPLLD
jgi:hypothetical protein